MRSNESVNNPSAVYLFPFTVEALAVFHALERKNIPCSAFLDNNTERFKNKQYSGIPIIKPLKKSIHGTVIICGFRHYMRKGDFENAQYFEDTLTLDEFNDGFSRVDLSQLKMLAPLQYRRSERFEYEIMSFRFINNGITYEKEPMWLSDMQLSLTSRCTLKCKDCNDLMPYYACPKDRPLDEVLKDIENLFNILKFIRVFSFWGGEAFLYPHLEKVLAFLTEHRERFGYVYTGTNGTIVPKQSTIAALKRCRCFVIVSDYGELSKNKEKVVSVLREAGIGVQLNKFSENTQWWEPSKPCYDLRETEEERQYKYDMCTDRRADSHLHRGKIYRCHVLAFMEELRGIPYNEKNGYDLLDGTIESLNEYIYRTEPAPGCDYCTGCNRYDRKYSNAPAMQIDHSLPYVSFTETYPS